MKTFIQLLVYLGWYRITNKDLKEWQAARKVVLLRLALRKGKYKIRKEAAKSLGFLKDKGSISILGKATKDEVRVVGEAAIASLKSFLPSLIVEQMIVEAETYWLENERIAEGWKNYHKARTVYIKRSERVLDRSKMKMLGKVRQQLKTPMYGCGWKFSN